MTTLALELQRTQSQINHRLSLILESGAQDRPPLLQAAMVHGTLGGGKRLRPFLHLMTARLFGAREDQALSIASALELIHCYSLIHDDLPCMDNSPLRRGLPSVHAAFGEATAVLAGSALHDLAYEILTAIKIEPPRLLRVIKTLTHACGGRGMMAGQHLDLEAEKEKAPLTLDAITHLQDLKTGALLKAALETAVHAFAPDDKALGALRLFGHHFGLAFQITDDLLDWEGNSHSLGKPTHRDDGKATFITLLGLEGARAQAATLIEEACCALEDFGPDAQILQETARSLLTRCS